MRRLLGSLNGSVLPGIAAAALAVALAPAPAAADSLFFSYSSGFHGHRHHHHHHRYHHGWHHGHRHHHSGLAFAYTHIAPPPVYYYAPPRVVYAPPPAIYLPPIAATPVSPVYQTPSGQYCREYQSNVIVGGRPQSSYGTACLQPDGVWRVVN